MHELEIGIPVAVTDARTLGAVGIAHVPGPVRPHDLIAFGEGHPGRGMPAVTNASLAVVQDAINAGVWVFGGGLENQKASIVAFRRP